MMDKERASLIGRFFNLTLFGWAIVAGLTVGAIIAMAMEFGEELPL